MAVETNTAGMARSASVSIQIRGAMGANRKSSPADLLVIPIFFFLVCQVPHRCRRSFAPVPVCSPPLLDHLTLEVFGLVHGKILKRQHVEVLDLQAECPHGIALSQAWPAIWTGDAHDAGDGLLQDVQELVGVVAYDEPRQVLSWPGVA